MRLKNALRFQMLSNADVSLSTVFSRDRRSMVRMYDRNKTRIDGDLVGFCFWKEMGKARLRPLEGKEIYRVVEMLGAGCKASIARFVR